MNRQQYENRLKWIAWLRNNPDKQCIKTYNVVMEGSDGSLKKNYCVMGAARMLADKEPKCYSMNREMKWAGISDYDWNNLVGMNDGITPFEKHNFSELADTIELLTLADYDEMIENEKTITKDTVNAQL